MGKYDYYSGFEWEGDNEFNVFEEIKYSNDVTLVENVSQLRHHINCHGISKKLKEYLHLNEEQIAQVVDCARGNTSISDLINNYEKVMAPFIEEKKRKQEAMLKNEKLISLLKQKRENMCMIGTRKLKLFLNKLVKQGDIIATLYRTALEIEDFNIKAKDTRLDYKDKVYAKKHEEISKLIELCKKHDILFGKQQSDVKDTGYVVYFNLPGMEQISFHTDLNNPWNIPDYPDVWDGKRCSTLYKIEDAINVKYGKMIEEKYL